MLGAYGYGCEVYRNITTEDGYINTLHRIIPKSIAGKAHLNKTVTPGVKRKVVFLQHGLLGTSADYVMGSPEKSLGKDVYFLP